jgi:Zn-dependent protease with chaperone function
VTDFARFLDDCVTSGAILRLSTCGLLIVPAGAWLAVRSIAWSLRRMRGDPEWQAPLAAAAIVVPRVLLLIMAVTAVAAGLYSTCARTYTGRALFGAFVAWTLFLLVKASWLAAIRARETRALLEVTVAPSQRLQRLAATCGIAVRELRDDRQFCALAGWLTPLVIVSTGCVSALSDGELRAALLHERGHAKRGDHIIAPMLAFSIDVFPLPSWDLLRLYRDAREYAADRHALLAAAPLDLAGALLTVARGRRAFAHLASFADANTVGGRLCALLDAPTTRRASVPLRISLVAALLVVFLAGLLPVRSTIAGLLPCPPRSSAAFQNIALRGDR